MKRREATKIIIISISYLWFLIFSFLLINRFLQLPLHGKVFILVAVFMITFSPLLFFLKRKEVALISKNETIFKKLLFVGGNSLSIFLLIIGLYTENYIAMALGVIIYIFAKVYYIFK